jgi:AraC-like DNA-binding protein
VAARLEKWQRDRVLHKRADLEARGTDRKHARRHIIERFFAEQYQEAVGLGDLARDLHLSASRTGHLVKEVCGRTFKGELRRYRLRHAAGLLWQGEDSITDVAMACGFGDVSNFHKAFRSRYGVTPLQYRKHGYRPARRCD